MEFISKFYHFLTNSNLYLICELPIQINLFDEVRLIDFTYQPLLVYLILNFYGTPCVDQNQEL